MKNYKHAFGTRNPIMAQEEEAMLLSVERALASSSNAQTIGRNGEIPFLRFLQRYLPLTLKATTGHFITPSGTISPQLDVIVADARYPLLSENADGSALVMLHSVVHIFEIKTNLTTKDINKSLANAVKTMALAGEAFDDLSYFEASLLAYNCANRRASLEETFFSNSDPSRAYLDAVLLRYSLKDRTSTGIGGGLLHLEMSSREGGYFPISIPSKTPLSDLYYRLVMNSYYTIGARDYSLSEIGAQFMDYMSWATTEWPADFERSFVRVPRASAHPIQAPTPNNPVIKRSR